MKVLALYHLKGGVGKTAGAVNIAALSARARIPTLLWDLDPQAAATWTLLPDGVEAAKPKALWSGTTPIGDWVLPTGISNLSLLPADLASRHLDSWLKKEDPDTLKHLLKPLAEQFSLCVLDCPPSLSHLADQVFAASNRILLPTVPTHLSLRALKQVLDYFAEHKLNRDKLMPYWSLADRRRSLHKMLIDAPPKTMPAPCKAVIPYSSIVEKMGERHAAVQEYAPDHPVGEAYRQLWKEVKAELKL